MDPTPQRPVGGPPLADQGIVRNPDIYTGSRLVLLDAQDLETGLAGVRRATGIAASNQIPYDQIAGTPVAELAVAGTTVTYPQLGVAVVHADPDQLQSLATSALDTSGIVHTERERYVYALSDLSTADYIRGYADGVADLRRRTLANETSTTQIGTMDIPNNVAFDESQATWGLQVTRTLESCLTGQGSRIAILDTGIATKHPDFVDRPLTTATFVVGQDVEDGHGHGTHCAGTACGPIRPSSLPRYGIAGGASVYVGKVLSNSGSGTDSSILAGLNWALSNNCHVASMSLGAPTQIGDPYSPIYEEVGKRALQQGMLIVAAAGNSSARPDSVAPVNRPANSPSILAVAALDRDLTVAPFSCAGLNADGGQVDIAGPGVDVFSAAPGSPGHRRLSGTSMATPHVAGILGLMHEACPNASAAELQSQLMRLARRLASPSTDVGAGLIQAL